MGTSFVVNDRRERMLERFLNHLEVERNYSEHTVSAYKTDLEQFLDFIYSLGHKDVKDVTRHDILNFLKYLKLQRLSPTTSNRKLAAIKSYYRFLMVEGVVNVNPAELIESAKTEEKVQRIVTTEEFKHIMSIIDKLEDRALIELLFTTGVRREEVVTLKRKDFSFNLGVLKINGKGKKERMIPILPEIIPNTILWLKQHDNEWVFPSSKNPGRPNTVRWVNKIVRKWADKAGYTDITPHSFRHAFGTHLYENGADAKAIQEMMGHESIDTTNIYAQSSIKRTRQEFIKAHPLIKRPK